MFDNSTSAHIELFSARKWCENVTKKRKYNQLNIFSYEYDTMQKKQVTSLEQK